MDYSLAKELKDAGFPFEGPVWKEGAVYPKGVEPFHGYMEKIPDDDQGLRIPTLSELIEAIGQAFQSLELSSGIHSDRRPANCFWIAHAYKLGVIVHEKASTPEEAVARLYLQLNKK